MAMSRDDILENIRETLVEALAVEPDEVTEDATLEGDLGAESIDFLDIKFRLEKSFDMTLRQAMEWEASHQAIMLQTAEHKAIVRGVLAAKKAENDSGQ